MVLTWAGAPSHTGAPRNLREAPLRPMPPPVPDQGVAASEPGDVTYALNIKSKLFYWRHISSHNYLRFLERGVVPVWKCEPTSFVLHSAPLSRDMACWWKSEKEHMLATGAI